MKKQQQTSRILNVFLWLVQALLAAGFIWAAAVKLLLPADKLAAMWPWTAPHPLLVKFTAVLDLVAGIGLVLPAMLGIRPQLTVYAAYGTLALMLAASGFHILRGEAALIGINIAFALMAVFVAWGRQKRRA